MSEIAPNYLPQVSAPHEIVINKLNEEGINCELIDIDTGDIKPIQAIAFSDKASQFDIDNNDPSWLSKDNELLDGHHRYLNAIMNNKPLKCVKIDLDKMDAIRILNKIQDIYDYELELNLEEVVNQDVINAYNDINSDISTNEFLATIEEMKSSKLNSCKVYAYREKPIMENSKIGNFFMLNPMEGFDKYEIEFENLLDTSVFKINHDDNEHPVDLLAKNWFPNVDFESLSNPYNIPVINLKNMAIADRAKKLGYDGIKYSDSIIQGLK